MKKLIAFGLVALAALTACNTQTELFEDDSTDLTFFAPKAGTASSGLRLQAEGDIPALKVRLRVKNQRNAAGKLEKVASATFKWEDTLTTLGGAVTLETRKLNTTSVLGSTTATISSNKTSDAVVGYTGNVALATPQVIGTDALCVDATWTLDTGGATPAFAFSQTQKVTFCQKQPPPAVADMTVSSAGSVSAASTVAKPLTLSVRNNGPKAATNVVVTVPVPAGLEYIPPSANTAIPFFNCVPDALTPATVITCSAASMGKSSKDIKINFKGATLGTYTVTASVTSATIDPINANNSGNASFIVTNTPPAVIVADMAVAIVQPSTPAPKVGTDFTYTISITNTGPDVSTAGRTLTLYRSSSLTFSSATAAGITCTNTGDITTCTLPSIPNAGTVSLPLVVTPSAAGTVGVTAELASRTEDTSSSNDSTSVSSEVQP
jgi:uncharacterized repeat protein (TIGR01451 family)